ncbi:HU family DNA-binding protein [Mailhella sp.]|uniref:HU family DNA-binding protein n=1 Tax=Mailhella sp. TaxID=1981029 RepID=UPI0040646616
MTSSEIVKKFAAANGLPEAEAKAYFNSMRDILAEAIASGEAQVYVFGVFRVKEYAARFGVNPKNGEHITIPACKKIKFAPSSMLTKKLIEQ